MSSFGEPEYWIDRYDKENNSLFDWLEDYKTLQPLLNQLNLSKDSYVLNIGCGNSEFSELLYDEGFVNNINIDIAPNVIKFMNNRKGNREKLVYEVMDVRELTYKDEMFDLVIDKGTIDALLCGKDSDVNVAIMTKEISRVLKTGGIYFIISYGKPQNREYLLKREHLAFDIKIYCIEKNRANAKGRKEIKHYIYVCKKTTEANDKLKLFDKVYEMLQDEAENED